MKRVLVITYHWPPSGGIGVLRCLKLVKYLREFGWEPVVFTAENAKYQFLDESNKNDIPAGIEIHKVPIFEPINLFKRLTGRSIQKPLQNVTNNSARKKTFLDTLSIWVRGNFFIPDARAAWIKPSVKYLEKYLEQHQIDAIFTDGPPHTNTVIGMRLSQKFHIPWLADFQDPWTQVDYYSKMHIGTRADRIHRRLEQEVFQNASKITIASPTWKKELESIGAKHVDVFYYGYDEADFRDYHPLKDSDKFIVFHGGLLGNDRNPQGFFTALKELIDSSPDFREKLEIRLAGEVDISVINSIQENQLSDYVRILGMLPRKEIIKQYETSSLLLLPINIAANAAGRIPGKLFELLRAQKPILVLGPDDSDVKQIVEETNTGKQYEYNDKEGIKDYVNALFDSPESASQPKLSKIEQFSNYQLTEQIAQLLNEISQ